MGFKLGIFAGELAKYIKEDNDRVISNTDTALDRIAAKINTADEKRRDRVREAEQGIERLSRSGFSRTQAASIVRGGTYAVADAMKKAEEAMSLGKSPDEWYKATAEYNPDDYANYTNLQLAEATVAPIDVTGIKDAFTKGRRLNMDQINEQMKSYAPSGQQATTALPEYKLDMEEAVTADVKTMYSNKLNEKFSVEEKLANATDDTQRAQLEARLQAIDSDITRIYDFGTKNKIFKGTGFTGPETRTNFNAFLSRGLNRVAAGGDFGTGAVFDISQSGTLIPKYDPAYQDVVDAQTSSLAAEFIGNLMASNKYQTESEATMSALGFKVITITEEDLSKHPDLQPEDVGRQAVNYSGYLSIIPEANAT
jgi:hypothetical protein